MSRYKIKKFKKLFLEPEEFERGDIVIGLSKENAFIVEDVCFTWWHQHKYIKMNHFLEYWNSDKIECRYAHAMPKGKREVIRIIEK